jgi:hypothetical protein
MFCLHAGLLNQYRNISCGVSKKQLTTAHNRQLNQYINISRGVSKKQLTAAQAIIC